MRIVGLITVVETPEFLATIRGLFDEDQRALLISYLAAHPLAGDLIAGTGGVRKLRWATAGRGKRGGGALSTSYTASVCRCSYSQRTRRTCART
jgi:hypothetical protein